MKIRHLTGASVLAIAAFCTIGCMTAASAQEFCLTVLHNNDAESQLINAGSGLEDFGGADRFAALLAELRETAEESGCAGLVPAGEEEVAIERGSITVSSGDNFLASPELNASLENERKFFDAILVSRARYDAMAIGNHEFDFGPDVLADFIEAIKKPPVFLSANLDFALEPRLQNLVDQGLIAPSTTVEVNGRLIGIVGATTPELESISSPRDVVVLQEVADLVQAEIDALSEAGADIIVLISHLQGINEDLELVADLSGIDIVIAGGGDELLVTTDDDGGTDTLLVQAPALDEEGDQVLDEETGEAVILGDLAENAFGPYPSFATNADGNDVPVVTTAGDLKYVGGLEVLFDAEGNVTAAGGQLNRVSGIDPDAVEGDRRVRSKVVRPVEKFVAALAKDVIGSSEVALEGRRDPGIRTEETNLGNLIADSLLWQAQQLAVDFDQPEPAIAIQNGGGIRNNTLIPAGDITALTTFDIAPFTNFVSIIPDISRKQFKEIMENAVSAVEEADGRFAHVAGMVMEYDLSQEAYDPENPDATPGERVRSITLDDGTAIVTDGEVVDGDALVIATIDFLARGGDQYPFDEAPFTSVGVSYQQALANYITEELGGSITAADYPEGGEGRLVETPAP